MRELNNKSFQMDKKKKLEFVIYWIIRLISIIFWVIAIYVWIQQMKK